MDIRIEGGRALIDGRFEDATIDVNSADGAIVDLGREGKAKRRLDASGLLVLPGIVDIHGDAFERQMMPRPGVDFALDIALLESDRQAVANGMTTVFHGVTWSWEPGLRGPENARLLLETIEQLRLSSALTRASICAMRPTTLTPKTSSPGSGPPDRCPGVQRSHGADRASLDAPAKLAGMVDRSECPAINSLRASPT